MKGKGKHTISFRKESQDVPAAQPTPAKKLQNVGMYDMLLDWDIIDQCLQAQLKGVRCDLNWLGILRTHIPVVLQAVVLQGRAEEANTNTSCSGVRMADITYLQNELTIFFLARVIFLSRLPWSHLNLWPRTWSSSSSQQFRFRGWVDWRRRRRWPHTATAQQDQGVTCKRGMSLIAFELYDFTTTFTDTSLAATSRHYWF